MIRLPDNPADRKKAIAAMAVGGLALLFVSFTYGFLPYRASVRARRERVAELENEIWRAQKDLSAIDRVREQNSGIVARILAASEEDRHILRPSLGNYLLVATDVINRAAVGLDIQVDTINELPRTAPVTTPKKNDDTKTAPPPSRFDPYSVSLSITGGLHELARFLHRLESANPYATLTRLIVMQQSAETPEKHYISLHLQWPIWVDDSHPQRLQAEVIADEERQ